MRRALVLIAVVVASLSAAVPASAPAARAARAGREVERELAFELPSVEGIKIGVFVNNNDGDVTATLFLSKAPQIAYYSTPAKITAKRVTARFGTLGELDFRIVPKGKEGAMCFGAGKAEGYAEYEGEVALEGTFTFTGENEYVHIEADHAEGTAQVYPAPKGCSPAPVARRAVPYHPGYSDEGATLRATAGSRPKGPIREVGVTDNGRPGRHSVYLYGLLFEQQEGMDSARGVEVTMPSAAFHWNLGAGTATVRPAGPCTGSAKFTRQGNNGHGTWTGSLAMPILGGETVGLAGSEFRAYMHKGVPQDE
jgi:hypothetical protein